MPAAWGCLGAPPPWTEAHWQLLGLILAGQRGLQCLPPACVLWPTWYSAVFSSLLETNSRDCIHSDILDVEQFNDFPPWSPNYYCVVGNVLYFHQSSCHLEKRTGVLSARRPQENCSQGCYGYPVVFPSRSSQHCCSQSGLWGFYPAQLESSGFWSISHSESNLLA